eukprot:XP_014780851.1 PREDICTED: uncharacterized protein LOC106876703 [Octopus bimaculoides]
MIILGGVLLIILILVLLVVIRCHVSSKKQNCDYDPVNKTLDQENCTKSNTAEEPPEDDGFSNCMAKINTNNKTSLAKLPEEENISYYLAKINASDHDEKSNIFGNSYQNIDL